MDSDTEYEFYNFPICRSRLYELFGLIEKEFEVLFAENLARKYSSSIFDFGYSKGF